MEVGRQGIVCGMEQLYPKYKIRVLFPFQKRSERFAYGL